MLAEMKIQMPGAIARPGIWTGMGILDRLEQPGPVLAHIEPPQVAAGLISGGISSALTDDRRVVPAKPPFGRLEKIQF